MHIGCDKACAFLVGGLAKKPGVWALGLWELVEIVPRENELAPRRMVMLNLAVMVSVVAKATSIGPDV